MKKLDKSKRKIEIIEYYISTHSKEQTIEKYKISESHFRKVRFLANNPDKFQELKNKLEEIIERDRAVREGTIKYEPKEIKKEDIEFWIFQGIQTLKKTRGRVDFSKLFNRSWDDINNIIHKFEEVY